MDAKAIFHMGKSTASLGLIVTEGARELGAKVDNYLVQMAAGSPEAKDVEALSDCYKNCIIQAKAFDMRSLAFCCISTGEFSFPRRQAAEIAIDTVLKEKGGIEVVFDVYTDEDYRIYKEILAKRSGI